MNSLLQSNVDQELNQVLQKIEEFRDISKLRPYYVDFERPQLQNSLYLFWVKTIDLVLKEYWKSSIIIKSQLKKCFQFGTFQPIGLENILIQIQSEKGIVTLLNSNYTCLKPLIYQQLKITQNDQVRDVSKQKTPTKNPSILERVKGSFGYIYSKANLGFKQKSILIDDNAQIVFLNQFKTNIQIFTSNLESLIEKSQHPTFILPELVSLSQDLKNLSKQEINFLLDTFVSSNIIKKLNQVNYLGTQQTLYIYLKIGSELLNELEIQKSQNIFLLKNQLQNINIILQIRNEKLKSTEQDLIKAYEIKKSVQEKKSIFKLKILYEKSILSMEQKKIILIEQLDALETAISDNQLLEVISINICLKYSESVNQALKIVTINQNEIKENLEQFQDQKLNQEEITQEMNLFFRPNEKEIEEEFQRYQSEIEKQFEPQLQPMIKQVELPPQGKRRSKWFEDNVDQQKSAPEQTEERVSQNPQEEKVLQKEDIAFHKILQDLI